MKTTILAFFLTLLTATAAVAQRSAPVKFEVSGVGYDSTYAAVIKAFGKPAKQKDTKEYSTECRDKPTTFREMDYDGLEIGLMGTIRGRNMRVYSIGITSTKWNSRGVTVGASEADVIAKFGKPRLRSEFEGKLTLEYDTTLDYVGLDFYFENAKLVRINLWEPLC